MIKFFTSHV